MGPLDRYPSALLFSCEYFCTENREHAEKKTYEKALLHITEALHYAQGWNRTADIRIFSPPLYHLSYRGI